MPDDANPESGKLSDASDFQNSPDYLAAKQREEEARAYAWDGFTYDVAGVEVRAMTPLDLSRLSRIGSPYVCGGVPNSEDTVIFLGLLSPRYQRDSSEARQAFAAEIGAMQAASLEAAVKDYLEQMFLDEPPTSKGNPSERAPTDFLAAIVDRFARHYGWDDQDIVRKPLPQLYQLMTWQRLREGDTRTSHKFTAKVTGERLRRQNAARAAGTK